jgi:hypothetical protein
LKQPESLENDGFLVLVAKNYLTRNKAGLWFSLNCLWRQKVGRLSFVCTMSTRRKFLRDCSTVVAALALAPLSSLGRSVLAGGNFQSLEQMSYLVLAGQINTLFRVRVSPRQVVELKLLKAPLARATPSVPGRRAAGDAGNEKFSLIFSGPKETLLASAIHRFEHRQLGRFEMYIGQVGTQDATSVRYEAGFNRPAPAASSGMTST